MYTLSVLALASSLCTPARAQEGFDAYDLFLAPQDGDPRNPLVVHRPGVHRAGDVHATVALSAAGGTLWSAQQVDGGEPIRTTTIGQLATINLVAGVAAHERVRFNAAAPFHLMSTGTAGSDGGLPGDVRLSSEVVLVAPQRGGDGLSLQLVPWVVLPTGRADVFPGRSGVGGGGVVNAHYGLGTVGLTGEAGIDVNPAADASHIRGDDELRLAAAISALVDPRTAVGLEGRVELPIFTAADSALMPAEIIGSVRQRSRRGAHWMAGAGAGLTRGIGAPAWRLVVGGGFGRGGVPDGDGDGLADLQDLCPDEPETWNGWQDDDGCPDSLADVLAVPTIGGLHRAGAVIVGSSGDEVREERGRPLLLHDRMPTEVWTFAGHVDCHEGALQLTLVEGENRVEVPLEPVHDARLRITVVGNEADALADARATWLDAPVGCGPFQDPELTEGAGEAVLGAGRHQLLLEAAGHHPREVEVTLARGAQEELRVVLDPVRVSVLSDRLDPTERVHFDFDSAQIDPRSLPLLQEIAGVVRGLPERGTVTIAGHSDERGPDSYNDELSRRRAEAVRAHLVSLGVPSERLAVRAHGRRHPLVSGSGDAVWAENRRVQFHLHIDEFGSTGAHGGSRRDGRTSTERQVQREQRHVNLSCMHADPPTVTNSP